VPSSKNLEKELLPDAGHLTGTLAAWVRASN
jgi:hypothetical protein